MKALTRTLLVALAGALTLISAPPTLADRGRGWDSCDYREHPHRPYWKAHKHHHPVYGPPVVIHRPPVVIYEPPVVYERRFYYGPTYYTPYSREPSVSFSFTVPLR